MVAPETKPQPQHGSFEGMKRVFDPFNGEMHADSSPPIPPVRVKPRGELDVDGVFEGTTPTNVGC
jgi:hypothetical protein